MRLSFEWLSDYVDLQGITPHEVAEKLTMGAFEVEEITVVGAEIVGPIVVGEILAINPHPNADKIRLTKVKVASDSEPLEIVCGAQNIAVGQRIPVALPGARVVNRHDGSALEIKLSKIRGVQSNGMLCSPPELGITDGDGEGILILNGNAQIGADAKELLQLYPDYVLHVEPRSNRGDAMSVKGMAREVAALCSRALKQPNWQLESEKEVKTNFACAVESAEDCPLFTVRCLSDVKIGPSSAKIQRRLKAIGLRPVNNIVDVTNYVLHELGQPLHAYDLSKLKGERLSVRRAKSGETLATIDGRQRELTSETLVIADGSAVVGVAGVMGGKDSEIVDSTKNIVLEAAAFHYARVRRSARALGLSSDSSVRFERGVDIAQVKYASDYASYLILQTAGGQLGALTQAGSSEVKPVSVKLRMSALARLVEIDLKEAEVANLLKPLGFETNAMGSGLVDVSIPSFRQKDVTQEADLVEEVCRLWGYDRVPVSMPDKTMTPNKSAMEKLIETVRQVLAGQGLNEAVISSLVGLDDFSGQKTKSASQVAVLNPLSDEHQVLRQSLVPGLIKALKYNQDRGQGDVWLYEVGRTYEQVDSASDRQTGVNERLHVSGIIAGGRQLNTWQQTSEVNSDSSFYAAKGIVQNVLQRLCLNLSAITLLADNLPSFYHPGRSCRIMLGDICLACVGEIHPKVQAKAALRKSAYIFDLNLDALEKALKPVRFAKFYATPTVHRDLTADVSCHFAQQAVQKAIRDSGGQYLTDVCLVSVFPLSDNVSSLSYRLSFQHPEATLTNEEIETYLVAIRKALADKVKAGFRL